MSKSKGEFLTVSLLEERGFDPLVYRYFCLQSHYRKNLVFSWENLENAKVAYGKLVSKLASIVDEGELDEAAFAEGKKRFTDALDNDLNTSLAVTALYDVFKLKTNGKTKLALVAEFDKVLCIGLLEARARALSEKKQETAAETPDVSPELLAYINEMIAARKQAKADKNYAEADRIRVELLEKGITLVDTREGTKFTVNN